MIQCSSPAHTLWKALVEWLSRLSESIHKPALFSHFLALPQAKTRSAKKPRKVCFHFVFILFWFFVFVFLVCLICVCFPSSFLFPADGKKKGKKKSLVADEEAEAIAIATGPGGNNSHPMGMNMNAISPAGMVHNQSMQHQSHLHSDDNVDNTGQLNDSALSDSEHRKSRQEEEGSNPRKEKSVLQAKLTKLAIQIGYGGKNFNHKSS